ncbi:Type III effector HopF2 [Pseudomonas syringae pv. aceris]|nr:Type III effector HopF2 [Pseudomonas syringae pv. aceris]
MRLGDFLEKGGKVYSDISSAADDGETARALIVTLPRGKKVPVDII